MACIELSTAQQAELIQIVTDSVVAAAGDRQRAAEFAESIEVKGIGWLAAIVFDGMVKDVTPWHSGYNIEFVPAFTTKHRKWKALGAFSRYSLAARVGQIGVIEEERVVPLRPTRILARGARHDAHPR